ncbi:MAG: tRNA (adenosine(37)-N6)-dimethylallyltransferase MiaA [Kangiellaceae bacterium]
MKESNLPVIFIMGPTASGKTALAIDLVQKDFFSAENQQAKNNQIKFNGFEIISVDSTLVYTQMNIGSAKPTESELVLAPHHLIDFLDPKDSYSVSQFCSDALNLINDIHSRNKVPLLVGGTMLYFKALTQGIAEMPVTDNRVRAEIQEKLKLVGIESLHKDLQKVDPISAQRLNSKDTQRITRALEVFKSSGKPISQWHKEQESYEFPFKLLSIAISPTERTTLHERIAERFDRMIESGFLQEISDLYNREDLDLDCPSMRSVGYRQYWQYKQGVYTLDEAREKAIIATRQLAKRQLTWLRSWSNIHWFDLSDEQNKIDCHKLIESFLEKPCTT